MTATIRPAVQGDLPQILTLRAALTAHAHAVDPRIPTRPGDEGPPHAATWFNFPNPFPPFLVADDRGTLVGLVVTRPGHAAPDGSIVAHLELLYVAPSHRRAGLGRALVHAALDGAAATGHPHARVDTLATDPVAQAFWRSFGFTDLYITLAR